MTTAISHDGRISSEISDGVLTVKLPVSVDGLLSLATCDELCMLLQSPPASAHVLILESDGDAFCLGRERTAASVDELPGEVDRLVAVNHALRNTRLVSVAKVHGGAAGFGVGLAALSDFAIATSSAKFSFPEVEIGLAPVLVLAWLPQVVGRREAMRLTATGATISASRAVELGLLTEAVPDDQLDSQVTSLVADLRRRSPRVHAEIREFLRIADQATEVNATELARTRLVLGSLRRGRD
ncbi:enoyl-CoA hydratase/isomerase family protein [Mycolicibacterium mengxianglii]|uniref:enoyl-CoA hydratase/isomerase family protein n=1 Tax=Mycolicibacterium mengxianglii TaxID=2736649 RepID=UPI0018D1E7A4|nr:enoyl-CoA hydratase/isomerase family protein [Mycolicibacterium mengxianglii]